jgi:hypothetical protein
LVAALLARLLHWVCYGLQFAEYGSCEDCLRLYALKATSLNWIGFLLDRERCSMGGKVWHACMPWGWNVSAVPVWPAWRGEGGG